MNYFIYTSHQSLLLPIVNVFQNGCSFQFFFFNQLSSSSFYINIYYLSINEWGWVGYEEIILHILQKPNSLIALLFIQNNSKFKNIAKTCLPASMFAPNSIALRVVSLLFLPCFLIAIISPSFSCSSYSWNESNVCMSVLLAYQNWGNILNE